MQQLVIIGNGISGITCARHVRKHSNMIITVIGSETQHFFARTALMYIYMGHMKYEHTKPYEDFFWEKNKISLIHDHVEKVDTKSRQVLLKSGKAIGYDKLIIACGSKSNMPDLPGKDLKGVQGLYSFQDLEAMEANTKGIKNAVIAGGGLIGIEMAEMLLSRNINVTMLVREPDYWGSVLPEQEAKLIGRHIAEHNINMLVNTELASINGEKNVTGITTKQGKTIACDFVGLAIGVSPNISFLEKSGIETDKGVLINECFETNIADVYAIGDCAQFKKPVNNRKPLEQVWYTGRMHAETLARTIIGRRTAYNPAPWFNSAKFMDIEYQTYGDMPVKIDGKHEDFYWEHAADKKALRIRYNKEDGALQAINVFGIRLRHEIVQDWIIKKANISHVLQYLADANFDPELYRSYERQIIAEYNRQKNTQLQPAKRSWKRILQILNTAN